MDSDRKVARKVDGYVFVLRVFSFLTLRLIVCSREMIVCFDLLSVLRPDLAIVGRILE